MKNKTDIILNLIIFLVTLILVTGYFRKNGKWAPERGKTALRYFTCESNILCAVSSVITAVSVAAGEAAEWVRILKYAGTVAVTVTMATVFLFLAPSIGKGWSKKLLTGTCSDFCMHLLTPLLSLFSFCVLEKHEMKITQSLWGLLPVLLYGCIYAYKVLMAPAERQWKDFYGFNKSGRWPVSVAAMLAGTFLICLALIAVQNS